MSKKFASEKVENVETIIWTWGSSSKNGGSYTAQDSSTCWRLPPRSSEWQKQTVITEWVWVTSVTNTKKKGKRWV